MGQYEDALAEWGRHADKALAAEQLLVGEWTARAMIYEAAAMEAEAEAAALASELDRCRNVSAPIESTAKWLAGTWVLDQVGSVKEVHATQSQGIIQALASPAVTGYSVRVKWSDVEKSPGVYDFSILDAAREAQPNVKLSVRFMAGVHTPSFHKGWSFPVAGSTQTCPKPWNPRQKGQAGNPVFEAGWAALVDAFTRWSVGNGVRWIHLSQYGHKWAEMFYGDDLQNAWRADFGAAELTATVGSLCAVTVQNAHKRLLDLARPILPANHAYELPASGYSSQLVSGPVFTHARNLFGPDELTVQSNCWAGPYNCGRALGPSSGIVSGYQAFALGGPTNKLTSNRNTHTWAAAYAGPKDSCASNKVTYAEVYRETFADPTDLAAWRAAAEQFTFTPAPSL